MKRYSPVTLFIAMLLTLCTLLNACGGAKEPTTSSGTQTQSQPPEQTELPEYKEITMTNALVSATLGGYAGERINENITAWQINALRDNPNIIDQIAAAKLGLSFDSLLGPDFFDFDRYYNVDIVGKNGKNALGFTQRSSSLPSGRFDRDIKFGEDPGADTNWSDGKALLIRVDASEFTESVLFRLAFEEQAVGRESFELIPDKTAKLIFSNGAETETTVKDGGYVSIPAGFCGTLALPLTSQIFRQYWQENSNNRLDLTKVVQFQLSVRGGGNSVGKTLYINRFTLEKTEGGERNVWDFEGLSQKRQSGGTIVKWYGEFVGKLLTGMAFCYRISGDPDLKKAADTIVSKLAKAQGEDGYLGVFTGGARFALNADNWDLWNHYHAIVGLLEWHELTGSREALDVAKKAIDCIYNNFKDRSYLVSGGFETNRGIAHGYALMYEATKEQKYLSEAERIIKNDCQDANGWYKCALKGKDFYTSSSSRWEVLHMVMTLGILYKETKNEEYRTVMNSVWESIRRTDVHNTGGFTTNEGAQGDPMMDGVIETCCTVAWMALTNELYMIAPTVDKIDEIEKSFYNAMLGSLLDDGKYCTYNTPQNGFTGSSGGYDGRRVPSLQDISFQYHSGSPDLNCCQANLARGLGQVSQWALTCGGGAFYLNYYGAGDFTCDLDGKKITLKQETAYPADGHITITVGCDEPFTLKLRIPGWSSGSTVTAGGETTEAEAGTYFTVKNCKNGDVIILDLKMNYTYLKGENSQKGYTAVYRGPLLLALDSYYSEASKKAQKMTSSAIESGEVSKGDGAMILIKVKTDDTTLTLVDFASAGKYHGKTEPSRYYSFLKLTD